MTIKVGVAQIVNSTDIEENFRSIFTFLERFEKAGVDFILFPECCLSGFSARMKKCSLASLSPYLNKIQEWVDRTAVDVALPTAFVQDERVYNSGYWFKRGERLPFFKMGLTDSEKKFFSVPNEPASKVFRVRNYRFAILICFEAENEPWSYFQNRDVDAVLWPGYWGWTLEDQWNPVKASGMPNAIYLNAAHWKVPIIQANFSKNALGDNRKTGPEGLSVVIDQDNKMVHRGPHKLAGGFIVSLKKEEEKTSIAFCTTLQ